MTLFTITLILFLIMDPIGNISSFLSQLQDLPHARQRWVILREMGFALAAMVIFYLIGETIFNFLNISEVTLRISSGVILFIVALQILFSNFSSIRANLPKGHPFVIPLAIPLIAGPTLLATIMLYAHLSTDMSPIFWGLELPTILLAIIVSWLAALVVLMFSTELQRLLGDNGLVACEKLMGMILILLAIQRFMEGIKLFVLEL